MFYCLEPFYNVELNKMFYVVFHCAFLIFFYIPIGPLQDQVTNHVSQKVWVVQK